MINFNLVNTEIGHMTTGGIYQCYKWCKGSGYIVVMCNIVLWCDRLYLPGHHYNSI